MTGREKVVLEEIPAPEKGEFTPGKPLHGVAPTGLTGLPVMTSPGFS